MKFPRPLFYILAFAFSFSLFLAGCRNNPKTVKLFFVELYRPDQKFTKEYIKETGCDDHLVGIDRPIGPSDDPLTSALNQLFSAKENLPQGLYNSLSLSDLKLDRIDTQDGRTSIYLKGSYQLGGSCDDPRFVDQIKETVSQFSKITNPLIFIDGRSLEEFLEK
ncbi:GerMN domain-containing protein [Candidatus Peregrinibacteria bacterium]|nr:GerMN domain-containing protein [Candidatus Peregrinibacteria bacterium]